MIMCTCITTGVHHYGKLSHSPSATTLTASIQSLHIPDEPAAITPNQGKPKKLEDEISQTNLVKIMGIFSVSEIQTYKISMVTLSSLCLTAYDQYMFMYVVHITSKVVLGNRLEV